MLDGIYQAFTQVDSSASRNHGGVGVGLGISRQLAELRGGRLRAESPPPRFHLPFHPAGLL